MFSFSLSPEMITLLLVSNSSLTVIWSISITQISYCNNKYRCNPSRKLHFMRRNERNPSFLQDADFIDLQKIVLGCEFFSERR